MVLAIFISNKKSDKRHSEMLSKDFFHTNFPQLQLLFELKFITNYNTHHKIFNFLKAYSLIVTIFQE